MNSPPAPASSFGRPLGPAVQLEPTRPAFWPGPLTIASGLSTILVLVGFAVKGFSGTDIVVPIMLGSGCLVGVLWRLRRFGSRATVQLFEGGISVRTRSERHLLRFDTVSAMTFHEAPFRRNGELLGMRRRFGVTGPSGTVSVEHLALHGHPDPLGELVPELISRLADKVEEGLGKGSPLRGDGWRLDAAALWVQGRRIPRQGIESLQVSEGHAQFWVGEEVEPSISLPAQSANIYVLLELLTRAREEEGDQPSPMRAEPGVTIARPPPPDQAQRVTQPQSAAQAQRAVPPARPSPSPQRAGGASTPSARGVSSAQGLGRLLWRKTTGWGLTVSLVIVSGLLVAGAVALLRPPHPNLIGGFGVAAFSVLTLLGAWAGRPSELRIFEYGLSVRRQWTPEQAARDEEIDRLTYASTAIYQNGAYSGTNIALHALTHRGLKLAFLLQTRKEEPALEEARDRLAWAIATRWMARISRGHQVSWGNARIERGGLRLKAEPGSGQLLLLHELQFFLEEGELTVQDGRGKKLLAMATSVENFYPGLMVVKMLLDEEPPEALTTPRAQGG